MKSSIVVSLFLIAFCSTLSGQRPDSVKYHSLEPYDFHLAYLKDEKTMLIDVREPMEYRKKRIMGAVNIPSSGNIEAAADTIDRQYNIFVYCTTGYRSKRSAQRFCDKGFENVYNLEGGLAAWKKDGFPMEKKKAKRK